MGLVFISVFLSVSLFSCKKTAEKEIGLQLWSVRDAMKADAAATIAKVGEMGYDFVEAAGYADGRFYGMDPLEFKALVSESGMEFISSHTGRHLPDSSNWDETMAWWEEAIDAHAEAGVSYIVKPSMDKQGYGSKEDLKRYCDYFNKVGEMCNERGIRFGYHNHAKEFNEIEGEDGLVRYDFMLQNTDPEKVFFQLDLYWIMEGGKDAVSYFEAYPGRFLHWHVKDEKELGESGKMDFEKIWAAKELAGVKKYIVEVERYNFDPLVSVEKSLEFLKNAEYVK